ncbi:hypothetical protein GOBAR_DD09307 [Gossypium barbadense]|nr:hypothetical protein GOBAR_DD09307 [Gossypium barbadense]
MVLVENGHVAPAPKYKQRKVSVVRDFPLGCGRVAAPILGSSAQPQPTNLVKGEVICWTSIFRRSDLGKRMDEGQSSLMEAQVANLTAMEGEANAVFPNQKRYDPYLATYNEGWRDHPNLRYQNRATPLGFEQQNSQPYNMSQPNH